jgi:hypothetical protein
MNFMSMSYEIAVLIGAVIVGVLAGVMFWFDMH